MIHQLQYAAYGTAPKSAFPCPDILISKRSNTRHKIAVAMGDKEHEATALAHAALCNSSTGNFCRAFTLLSMTVGAAELVQRPNFKYLIFCKCLLYTDF